MDFLTIIADSAWITAIAGVVGSVVTYLVTKANNKKDISINDRMQLSKDQYQLIAELRQMMLDQKEEIESLRDEIGQLQKVNVSLIIENKELQGKITELNTRLARFDS